MKILNVIFPQRLKEARLADGLSQSEAAQRIGVCTEQWHAYERAKNQPTLPVLLSICRTLSRSADWLIGTSVAPAPNISTVMPTRDVFTARLKAARKYHRWPQWRAAQECGFGLPLWSAYEIGKCVPSIGFLERICQRLGVSADWLLGYNEPSLYSPAAGTS